MTELGIFAGSSHPELGREIARLAGKELGACSVERFPDGEITVRIEESVRRREVFVVQPTGPPVNENLVELLAFADALRRAAAERITAIVPYFGYSRSDRRGDRREPIMASLVARLMQSAGFDQVVSLDLHALQIEGFFEIPVDGLTAIPTLCAAMGPVDPDATAVVSPDVGSVKRATRFAEFFHVPLVVLHKRRMSGSETRTTHVVGDVCDRRCIIVDDMISTGGTIANSIEALVQAGARPEMTVVATHALFLEGSRERLDHPAVREIIVTDSLPLRVGEWPKVRVASIAPLLAAAIRRIVEDGSLSSLSSEPVKP